MLLFDVKDFLFNYDIQSKALVRNYYIPFSIVIFYLLFVQWIGPAFMKNRKPYHLKYTMIVYNFTQSCLNTYIFYQIFNFSSEFWEEKCLAKTSPRLPILLEKAIRFLWHLYLIKFLDLLETVFFVLRKKNNQVSYLHIFHHAMMCVLFWIGLTTIKQNFGFYAIFGLGINTAIHVVMYLYYGLAAFGPHMRKYLWWKKYLTVAQIGQFVLLLVYVLGAITSGCEDFTYAETLVFVYISVVLLLFLNFYRKYKKE